MISKISFAFLLAALLFNYSEISAQGVFKAAPPVTVKNGGEISLTGCGVPHVQAPVCLFTNGVVAKVDSVEVKNAWEIGSHIALKITIYKIVSVEETHTLEDGNEVRLQVLKLRKVASETGNGSLFPVGHTNEFDEVSVNAELDEGEYIAKATLVVSRVGLDLKPIKATERIFDLGTKASFHMVEESTTDGSGAPVSSTTIPKK